MPVLSPWRDSEATLKGIQSTPKIRHILLNLLISFMDTNTKRMKAFANVTRFIAHEFLPQIAYMYIYLETQWAHVDLFFVFTF